MQKNTSPTPADAEKTGPPPKHPRPTWRRRVRHARRWILRIVGWAVLVCLAVVLVLIHVPLSSARLDRSIRQIFADATDLELQFDKAIFRLARGRLDLAGVRIRDPLANRELLRTDSMRLLWLWRPSTPSAPARIDSIEIAAPAPQHIGWTNRKSPLLLDENLRMLSAFLNRASERRHVSSPPPRSMQFRVTGLDLYAHRDRADATAPRIAGIVSATLDFRREEDGYWRIHAKGQLAGPAPAPRIELDIRPLPAQSVYALSIQWERFELGERIQWPAAPETLRIPAGSLEIVAAMPGTENDGQLTVRAAQMRILDSRLRFAATVATASPHDFRIDATVARIGPDTVNAVLQAMPHPPTRLPLGSGRFEGEIHLAGDLARGPAWPLARAEFRARGLTAHWPHAPQALGPLDFDASLASGTLHLAKVSLEAGASQFQGRGQIEHMFDTKESPVRLKAFWTGDMRIEELLPFLPQAARVPLEPWAPHGAAWGSGSISSEQTPGQWQEMLADFAIPNRRLVSILSHLQIDGQARLDGLSVRIPHLQAPIRDLTGRLNVANDSITFSQIEGRLLGSRVRLSGQILGDPLVIDDPQLRMDIDGDIALSGTPDWLDPEDRAFFERYRPAGKISLDLFARGPLLRPDTLTLEGAARGQNLAASLDFPFLNGKLRAGEFDLRIAPDLISLRNASLKIDDLAFRTSGTLARKQLDLGIATQGRLENYVRSFPFMPEDWELSGPLRVASRLTLRAADKSAYPTTGPALSNLIDYARTLATADTAQPFTDLQWNLDGHILADGCALREPHMPEAVTEIRGPIEFDIARLRAPAGINARWGTAETITRGSVGINPDGTLEANFEVESPYVNANEWVKAWRYHLRQPAASARKRAPAPPPAKKSMAGPWGPVPHRFLAEGRVHAQEAAFQNLKGRNAEMTMRFENIFNGPFDLLFPSISYGDIHEGRFGLIGLRLLPAAGNLEWSIGRASVTDVNCALFLEALMGKPSTVNGRLTGTLSDIAVVNTDLDSMTGHGEFSILNSTFQENAVFSAIGKALRSKELEKIAGTDLIGEFDFEKGIVKIPKLRMRGPLVQMDASGLATFKGRLDLSLMYRFFGKLRLPVLKTVMGAIEHLGSYFIKVHVGGTLNDPKVTVIPLSLDKLPGFGDPWFGKRLEESSSENSR